MQHCKASFGDTSSVLIWRVSLGVTVLFREKSSICICRIWVFVTSLSSSGSWSSECEVNSSHSNSVGFFSIMNERASPQSRYPSIEAFLYSLLTYFDPSFRYCQGPTNLKEILSENMHDAVVNPMFECTQALSVLRPLEVWAELNNASM